MFDPPGCPVYYLSKSLSPESRPSPKYKSIMLTALALMEVDFLSTRDWEKYKLLFSDIVLRCPYDTIYTNRVPYRYRGVNYRTWDPDGFRGVKMCNYRRRSNCWKPRLVYSPNKKNDVIYYVDYFSHRPLPKWLEELGSEDLFVAKIRNIYTRCPYVNMNTRKRCGLTKIMRAKLVVFSRNYRCTDYEPLFPILEALGVPVFVEEGGSCSNWVPRGRIVSDSKPIRVFLEHYDTTPSGVLFEEDQYAFTPTIFYPHRLNSLVLEEYII